MAFISNYLLKRKGSLKDLPQFIRMQTENCILNSRSSIDEHVTSGQNWVVPNPFVTLQRIDNVSNECCKIIDSSQLLYRQFGGNDNILKETLSKSIDDINSYFGELNNNKKLLTVLHQIQSKWFLYSQLDLESQMLLKALIKDISMEQKSNDSKYQKFANFQLLQSQMHRQFQQNIRISQPQILIDKNQLKTIPIKQFQIKYEKLLSDDQKQQITLDTYDYEMLKYSIDPSVRSEFFNAFSNSCKSNLSVVQDICNLRRNYATQMHDSSSFWKFQQQRNLIQIHGSLRDKIQAIRAQIHKVALQDLQTISKLTGEKNIRYHDIVYLKEKLKAILLAREQNNIQMLTCFSLNNVLNGLILVLKDQFGFNHQIKTIELDDKTGKILNESNGFDMKLVSQSSDNPILFQISIQGRGQILMDMFQRPSKFNQHQVSTLTEIGCSTLEGQNAVAYIVDGMKKDAQFLSFDQVKTVFHEFGHALNIALCNTKYQYHSCARASLDIAEIPSHFNELYLKDYDFVSKFAFQPDSTNPIDKNIFRKMIFCEEIFRFMAFEETLFFTCLDIDLNSFGQNDLIDESSLLQITQKNLKEAFTCDRVDLTQEEFKPLSQQQVDSLIDSTLLSHESNVQIWDQVKNILFYQDQKTNESSPKNNVEYQDNYIFTRFDHLFDYEAGYHSYLVAKICSNDLFYKNIKRQGEVVPKKIRDLYSQGGAFDYRNNLF